ncbi:MAG: T9SS type A sorting domain-containing protein [Chitinophagales bacterium]
MDSIGNNYWKYVNPVGLSGITIQGDQPVANASFRCIFLSADYAGFQGQVLSPGSPIELNPINYSCSNIATAVAAVPDSGLSVYPDPFHNEFSFILPFELNSATISVHDAMGRLLYEEVNALVPANTSHSIHVSSHAGLVMLTVADETGKIKWSRKLISQ